MTMLSDFPSRAFRARVLAAFAAMLALGSGAALAQDDEDEEELEEIVVTGTQIKGAAISEALAVSVFAQQEIESMGVSSVDELLDLVPEQGQNFQSEAENISGGVNSVRGDIGAFNLRNMGTGNTLVLLNGRRMVQTAGYQTELVGGSFVPVNTVNPNEIPVLGIERVEILRDGASAIYGADAVAGVVNTVLRKDIEGLTVRGRHDWYDNVSRNDVRLNLEWGKFFNNGRTNVSVLADFYNRDRVNGQDDPRWSSEMRWRLPEDSPWLFDEDGDPVLSFRNTSVDSGYGQYDAEERSRLGTIMDASPWTDSGGEFEVFPVGHPACDHQDAWDIPASNGALCGLRDGVNRDEFGSATGMRYDLSAEPPFGRDLNSELDRYNLFLFLNHEFEGGVEAYTELSWYKAETNLIRHPATMTTGVELYVGAENYYNPFGPIDSVNRVPGLPLADVPESGIPLMFDFYRWVEYPRINDNTAETWRFLQGFQGTWGDWDWDTAVVWSEAKRTDITHNRISNNLMQEALNDSTPAAYNPWATGTAGVAEGTNVERALIDVYRRNKSDLFLVDFKLSHPELFNLPAGPVGFLGGIEYREESMVDDRDPRLDGTITFTDVDGDTFPFVSDVMNSSPSSDTRGSRDTTSLFVEFAVPVLETLDLQAAMRYEDASDYGDTTVGKLAFGWQVFEPLLIRGSWSEAFRAPNLITVNEGLVVRTNARTDYVCRYAEELWDEGRDPDDPRYNEALDNLTCSINVQRRAEGSEALVAEESTNTSIGLVFQPVDDLIITLDFWEIEKTDTIGLIGETNHSLIDLLIRIEDGTGNCSNYVGNPAMGYADVDPDDAEYFEYAGICPVGQWQSVDDRYANLDTRIVEGYDIGVFYSTENRFGSWDLAIRGAFYERYDQVPGPATQALIEAAESGVFPEGFPTPAGFGDLLRQDGNQEEKYNASLTWSKEDFGARVSGYYLSDFVQTSLGVREGQEWVVPSMTTYNASFDYHFEPFDTETRVRLGVNNFTDERAPLADRYFGYFADAHRDLGRYWYLDLRMDFE
jgi:outer membrane receptor for ferrienterochelin and colicin